MGQVYAWRRLVFNEQPFKRRRRPPAKPASGKADGGPPMVKAEIQ
jgi:hypothetical protein